MTVNTASSVSFPADIFHEILGFLSLVDSVGVLQACPPLYPLRSLWLAALQRARNLHPLPLPSGQQLSALDDLDLRRIAYHATALQRNWTKQAPCIRSLSRFEIKSEDNYVLCDGFAFLDGTNLVLLKNLDKKTLECWDISAQRAIGAIKIERITGPTLVRAPFVGDNKYTCVASCKDFVPSGCLMRLVVFCIDFSDTLHVKFTETFHKDIHLGSLSMYRSTYYTMCSHDLAVVLVARKETISLARLDAQSDFEIMATITLDAQLSGSDYLRFACSTIDGDRFHIRLIDSQPLKLWSCHFSISDLADGLLSSDNISVSPLSIPSERAAFQFPTSFDVCGIHGVLALPTSPTNTHGPETQFLFWSSPDRLYESDTDTINPPQGLDWVSNSGLCILRTTNKDMHLIRFHKEQGKLTTHRLEMPSELQNLFHCRQHLDDHLGILRLTTVTQPFHLLSVSYV